MRKIFAVVIMLAIFATLGATLVLAQEATLSTPCTDIAGISIARGNRWLDNERDLLVTGGVWDETRSGILDDNGRDEIFCQTMDDRGTYGYLLVGKAHVAISYADTSYPEWVTAVVLLSPSNDSWTWNYGQAVLDEQLKINSVFTANWDVVAITTDGVTVDYMVAFRGSVDSLGEMDLVLMPDGTADIRTPAVQQQ